MAFTVLPAGFVLIAFLLHVQAQHGGMGGGGGSKCSVPDIIIYIQKFLQSDWWRASQFIPNVVQKCEIECRKLKLVQKR